MKMIFPTATNYYNRLSFALANLRRSRVFGQGSWVVFGLFSSQFTRLIGNLILTRLLVPDAFGLMALVISIGIGLNMLCDVGIRGGVIKSERSNDPRFMQTVWTLQLCRGFVLAALVLAVTIPAANFYQEPMLKLILPFWALNVIISSTKSVALYLYDKQLILKRQVIAEFVAQVVALIFMISWAFISPSVWALVAGTMVGTVITVINSYLLFKGHHSKLAWDRDAVHELFGFGRWILLSSTMSYVGGQGDKLIMGIWLTMDQLGIYSIASALASVFAMLVNTLSSRLLQPLYRQYVEDRRPQKIFKNRLRLNTLFIGACVALSLVGDMLIRLLYDNRYYEAGWMLQLLAIRGIGVSLNTTLAAFLLAHGNSFAQMKYQMVNTSVLLASMMFFGSQFGVLGLVTAYSFTPLICHPYIVLLARAHGFHCLRLDLSIMLGACLAIGLGWWAMDAPALAKLIQMF